MLVWIIQEYGTIIGVCSSLEKANEASLRYYMEDEPNEYEITKNEYGNDWHPYSIQVWEVDGAEQ